MQDNTLNPPPPDTADSAPHESAALRRRSRQERQARVGILRNINNPPRPPTRRAHIMGRWLDLRSSRRPHATAVEQAAQDVVARLSPEPDAPRAPLPLRRAENGGVLAIDIAGLMASVAGIGSEAPIRAAYGATMRADGATPAAPPPKPHKPDILTAEAWIDDGDDEESDALAQAFRAANEHAIAPTPSQGRRRGLWIVLMGALLALVVLVLVPAWGVLQPA